MEIFKHNQSESVLGNTHLLLRKTFDALQEAVFIIDAKTVQITDCNSAASEMFGYSRKEMLGQITNFLHVNEAELKKFRDHLSTAVRERGHLHLPEFHMKRKNGDIFKTDHSVMPLEDDQGELIGWVSVIRDITERKRSEEALRLARFTVDNVEDAVYWMDSNAQIIDVNETACSMLGYAREHLLSLTVLDIDPEFTAEKWVSAWEALKCRGKITLETKHRTKDGRLIPVEIMANYLRFGGRELDCAFARDITDRKRTEEALRRSKKRFRSLVESTSDWVWEVDQKGVYTYVSPQILNLLGYAPEEVIGKKPFDLMPNDEAQRISEIFNSIIANKKPIKNLENINRHKDGRLVVLETSGIPFYDSHGDLGGYRGIDRDITERKLVEERLEASLREKETLLRELYHRTKNNMQVISNLIDLQALAINDERTLKLFKETQNRIKTMALVHEKLYQSKDLSNLNLKDYIGDLASALLGSYQLSGDRISLKLDIENISVAIDTATPCGLIINELMSNSLKHAFPGGRRGEISLVLHQSEEGEIDMRLSDDGIGLPKGFDFRSKRSLGLTLVRNLSVKQLNGTFEVRTGRPTEFHIKFKEPLYTARV